MEEPSRVVCVGVGYRRPEVGRACVAKTRDTRYSVIARAPAAEMLAASTMIYLPPASQVRDAQLADPRDHCDGPTLRSLGPSAASSLGPLASLGPSASLGPLASSLGSRAI